VYKLRLKPSAEKDLERLRGETWQRVRDALSELRNSPRPAGCAKLTDSPSWRIRIGDWRAVYDVDDAAQVVTILRIKHRKDVYRDL
jgi:mRNA interferase RelE/StbE